MVRVEVKNRAGDLYRKPSPKSFACFNALYLGGGNADALGT